MLPKKLLLLALCGGLVVAIAGFSIFGKSPAGRESTKLNGLYFVALTMPDPVARTEALAVIEQDLSAANAVYAMDAIRVLARMGKIEAVKRLRTALESVTEESFRDGDDYWQWQWERGGELPEDYAEFKAALYSRLDPRFGAYFVAETKPLIRLDEVRWGGVGQDGIPPLRQPAMVAASSPAAAYLADDNVVFGIEINGDARAYPQRILAWHEMFVDTVGGEPVAGVYCTLCGTVILFETRDQSGRNHDLGTSGFLYRSNKLMYDRATQSLWSTFEGKPVIGALVGQGIELPMRSVVTTTWGEWKKRHPDSTVLSLDTGHQRNYGEGVAYRSYFATDEIMFNVPIEDESLPNKAEVLALRIDDSAAPLAISVEFLAKRPVFITSQGEAEIIILTDRSGANRAYEAGTAPIESWDQENAAIDADGTRWTVTEAALLGPNGEERARLPHHRAFWFGWKNAYPGTRLIK